MVAKTKASEVQGLAQGYAVSLPGSKPGQAVPFRVHDKLGDLISEPWVFPHDLGTACSDDTLPLSLDPDAHERPSALFTLVPHPTPSLETAR